MNPENSNNEPPYLEAIREGQSNLLPHEYMRNGRSVDAVLWHGSAQAPRVQRIGALVFGFSLLLSAFCLAAVIISQHGWFGLVIPSAIGYGGARVVYKSIWPSPERPQQDRATTKAKYGDLRFALNDGKIARAKEGLKHVS